MGKLFIVLGLIWGVIGIGNLGGVLDGKHSDFAIGFSVIFQFVLFVFPGLILIGIGNIIGKKKNDISTEKLSRG